ncbi:frizzled-3-like [Anopheles aquasalis]|uniref:frizzled-3-like n=1 Tax=Anopheles aquasalis TaxID=42839 RepID=UPI00215B66CD|nr:frizzled-3-like [Anopheles aquasalis]
MTLAGGGRRKGRWRQWPLALATLVVSALSYHGGTVALEELRCERIALGACQNLEYNMTIASADQHEPLLFGGELPHPDNGTARVRWVSAERLVSSLRPIIRSGCSKQALFLFCSSLFPLCSPNAPRPVYPCRSLCEQVRRDCFNDPVSAKLWPDYLDCRLLPQPEKHELCMQVGSAADAAASGPATSQPAVPTVVTEVPLLAGQSQPASASSLATPPPVQPPSVVATGSAIVNGWPPLNLSSFLKHHNHNTHQNVNHLNQQQPATVGKAPEQPGWLGGGSLVLPSEDGRRTTELLLERSGGAPGWPCPVNYSLEYDRCVPRCGPAIDALYSRAQKELVEWWTLVLSASCFIFTLMSLVTFWARANGRLDYPDRPILFMVLCYNLLGLCYLERTILHQGGDHRLQTEVRTGGGDATPASAAGGGVSSTLDLALMLIPSATSDSVTGGDVSAAATAAAAAAAAAVVDCTIASSQCLAYYIIKHYLLLSASTWWLIFALCWYLSTAKQWSSEALERRSGLFHVLAWVVPFAVPIVALLRGNIQRFELTGFCTAIGLAEELPALVLLLSGAVLVLLALCALGRLRTGWNQRAHLSRLFAHVLTFAVCYLVPAVAATVCRMLERVEHELEPCLVAGVGAAGRCPRTAGYFSTLPTLLRLALTLLGGGGVAIWLWVRQSTDLTSGTGNSALPKGCTTSGYGYCSPINTTVAPTTDRCSIRKVGPGTTGTVRTPSRCSSAAPAAAPAAAAAPSLRTTRTASSQQATTRTYTTTRAPFAVQHQPARAGRSLDGAAKTHKYCYVYQPTHGIPNDLHTARSAPQCAAARTQQQRQSQTPAGYVPVRTVRRSFRPVGPLSMITRI